MSPETAPQINHEEVMQQTLAAARAATEASGSLSTDTMHGGNTTVESMGDITGPQVHTKVSGGVERVDAHASTNNANYEAYTTENGGSGVRVQRFGEGGKVYEHTYKNAETAQKFVSLIGKQVIRSAEQKTEAKRAA